MSVLQTDFQRNIQRFNDSHLSLLKHLRKQSRIKISSSEIVPNVFYSAVFTLRWYCNKTFRHNLYGMTPWPVINRSASTSREGSNCKRAPWQPLEIKIPDSWLNPASTNCLPTRLITLNSLHYDVEGKRPVTKKQITFKD